MYVSPHLPNSPQANKTKEDILLRSDLDAFQKKSPQKLQQIHYLLSQEDADDGTPRRINQEWIKSVWEQVQWNPDECQVLACGTDGFVEEAKNIVTALGFQNVHIF